MKIIYIVKLKSNGISLKSGEDVAYACRVTANTPYTNYISLGMIKTHRVSAAKKAL